MLNGLALNLPKETDEHHISCVGFVRWAYAYAINSILGLLIELGNKASLELILDW